MALKSLARSSVEVRVTIARSWSGATPWDDHAAHFLAGTVRDSSSGESCNGAYPSVARHRASIESRLRRWGPSTDSPGSARGRAEVSAARPGALVHQLRAIAAGAPRALRSLRKKDGRGLHGHLRHRCEPRCATGCSTLRLLGSAYLARRHRQTPHHTACSTYADSHLRSPALNSRHRIIVDRDSCVPASQAPSINSLHTSSRWGHRGRTHSGWHRAICARSATPRSR